MPQLRPADTTDVRRATTSMTRARAAMAACGCLLALLTAAASLPAGAATAGSVVGATVLSATTIDASGCASGVSGKTDFGLVTAGASNVTTLDCAVIFGSSNDTAKLRIEQTDALGQAMWMPSRGALDTAFDTDGRVTTATAPAAGNDYANAVTLQTDGRIVTAGHCFLGGATGVDACLARYNTDGSLDTTFDTDGRVTTATAPGAAVDYAYAMTMQTDGRIVIAGSCDMGATSMDACLARYNTDGSLDTTFDTDGRATTATAPTNGSDWAVAVTIQSDGKIVTAGYCSMGGATGYDACLARYNTDGSLDTTFDTDGRVTTATAPATGDDYAHAITIQSNGKLLTAGECAMGGATGVDACMARYNTDGSLDTTFHTDGRVTTATGPAARDDNASSVAVQRDGKILTAGFCDMGGATGIDACLARHDSNGNLDTTFHTDGRATTATAPAASADVAYAVAVQDDGKIITAGWCSMGGATGTDACLARYNPNGDLDASFDMDGRVTTATAPAAGWDSANDMTIQSDGRIITAGECSMGGATGSDACLASYDQGGAVSQYAGGTADWATPATSHFAACLRTVTNAAASWTPDAACAAANGAWWNAVPTTPSQIATTATGITNGTANLRFGLRTTPSQPAGSYIAPIKFTVVAP